jgi:hypothetical protein
MNQKLMNEAYFQSIQAFIYASKNNVPFNAWHPVFGIL